MSRILISGAGGFIGSELAGFLARSGHDVTATWRTNRRRLDCNGAVAFRLEHLDLIDAAAVDRVVGQDRFDAVVHAAAAVGKAATPDGLRSSIEDNVQAHANLVSAAVKARCRRFVFCSTISVYGERGAGPAGYLETEANPSSIYGWSKLAGEQVLDLACALDKDFAAVSLRLSGVHGRGRTGGALHAIASAARGGRTIVLNGPASRFRWLFIDDLLAAVAAVLAAPLAAGHQVCNLASADTFSLEEVARQVGVLCGSQSAIEVIGSAARNEVMNIDRAVALWGYAPTGLAAFLPGYLQGFAAEA